MNIGRDSGDCQNWPGLYENDMGSWYGGRVLVINRAFSD